MNTLYIVIIIGFLLSLCGGAFALFLFRNRPAPDNPPPVSEPPLQEPPVPARAASAPEAVTLVFRWRYVALAVAVFVVLTTVGIYKGGFVKNILFPKMDGDELYADIEFPRGTPIEVTQEAVQRSRRALEKVLANMKSESDGPLLRNVYTVTGESSGRRDRQRGTHLGQVIAEILPSERRGIHSEDIIQI